MRKINADNLIEELKSMRMTIIGIRSGKGVLKKTMEEYTKSVLRVIDEQATIDEWIPVEKGLPPMDEDVFLTAYVEIRGGTCDGELKKLRVVGSRDGRDRWTLKPTSPIFGFDYGSFRNKVIAWQPLPDPYEGE